MAAIFNEQELLERVRKLSLGDQRLVMDLVERLARPRGESGKEFLDGTQNVHIAPTELAIMEQAIEDACERISGFPEVNFDG